MTMNLKLTAAFGVVIVGVIVAIVLLQTRDTEPTASIQNQANTDTSERLIRDDSHALSTSSDNRVTVVEFLDFECEACLAMFPVMEQLRSDYEGRITFVVRYFPLPGHPNSMTAATAVEAAAQQGAFEPMYRKMFETQEVWGHNQASQKPTFLQYASELELDVDAFERTMDDPATRARVQRDIDDGTALGVTGTPTIYVNGVATDPCQAMTRWLR